MKKFNTSPSLPPSNFSLSSSILKTGFSLVFFCAFLTMNANIFAQGTKKNTGSETNISLEKQERKEINSKAKYYWNKHFSLRLSATYANLFDNVGFSRGFLVNFVWEDSWKWFSIVIDADYYHKYLKYNFTAKQKDTLVGSIECSIPGNLDCPIHPSFFQDGILHYRVDSTLVIFREAYFRFDLSKKVSLRVGTHTITWGKLDYLSPINALFPLRFSGGANIDPSRYTWPQSGAILSAFFSDQVELRLYYLPRLNLDPTIPIISRSINSLDGPIYAARLNVFLPKTLVSFSYLSTLDYISTDQRDTFVVEQASLGDDQSSEQNLYFYQYIGDLVPRNNYFAFELSTSFHKWRWQLEYRYNGYETNLTRAPKIIRFGNGGERTRLSIASPVEGALRYTYNFLEEELRSLQETCVNEGNRGTILSANQGPGYELLLRAFCEDRGGKIIAGGNRHVMGTSFVREAKESSVGFGFILILDRPGKKARILASLLADLNEQENSTPPEAEYNFFFQPDYIFIPFLHFNHKINSYKNQGIGFGLGYTGLGFSASLYYAFEAAENFAAAFSYEYTQILGGSSGGLFTNLIYDITQSNFSGLRISLSYTL